MICCGNCEFNPMAVWSLCGRSAANLLAGWLTSVISEVVGAGYGDEKSEYNSAPTDSLQARQPMAGPRKWRRAK